MANLTSLSMGGLSYSQTPAEVLAFYNAQGAHPGSNAQRQTDPGPSKPEPSSVEHAASEQHPPAPTKTWARTVFNTADPRVEAAMDMKAPQTGEFARLLACRSHIPAEGFERSRLNEGSGLRITKVVVGPRSTDWEIERYSGRHFLFRSIGLRVIPFVKDFFEGCDETEQREICSEILEVLLLSVCDSAVNAAIEKRWTFERADMVARRITHFLASACEDGASSYSNSLHAVFCDQIRSQLSGVFFAEPLHLELLVSCVSRASWHAPSEGVQRSDKITLQGGPDTPLPDQPRGWFGWLSGTVELVSSFREKITREFGAWAADICGSFVSNILESVILGRASSFAIDNMNIILGLFLNMLRGFLLLIMGASWSQVFVSCAVDATAATILFKIRDLTSCLHAAAWGALRTKQQGGDAEDIGVFARAITWMGSSLKLITGTVTGGLDEAWTTFVRDYKTLSGLWRTCKDIWDWFGDVRETCLAMFLDQRSFADRMASRYPATNRCIAVSEDILRQTHMTPTMAREFAYPRAAMQAEMLTVPKGIRKNYDDWTYIVKKAEERLKNKGADYESEPVLIVLSSPTPGIGKTCLTDTLTESVREHFNHLMHSSLREGEMLNTVESDDKFNSNYKGEPYLRVDDLGQFTPKKSEDFKVPAFSLINTMGSRGTKPTAKMPEAPDKGKEMVVHGVFWTMNLTFEYFVRLLKPHVASPLSFCDRFTLMCEVKLAPEWAAEFVANGNTLTREMILRSNYMCWEFHVYTAVGTDPDIQIHPKLDDNGNKVVLNIHHLIQLLRMQIEETAARRDGKDQKIPVPVYVPQDTPLVVSGLRTAPNCMKAALGQKLEKARQEKEKEKKKTNQGGDPENSGKDQRWIGWDPDDDTPWLYVDGGRYPPSECETIVVIDTRDGETLNILMPKASPLPLVQKATAYILHETASTFSLAYKTERCYELRFFEAIPDSPVRGATSCKLPPQHIDIEAEECDIHDDFSFEEIDEVRERCACGVEYATLTRDPQLEDDASSIQMVLESGKMISWALAQRFLKKERATQFTVLEGRAHTVKNTRNSRKYPLDTSPIPDPEPCGESGTFGARLDEANAKWGSWFARRRSRLAAEHGRKKMLELVDKGDKLEIGLHMATLASNILHEALEGDAILAYYMREELLRCLWGVGNETMDQITLSKMNVIAHKSFWSVTLDSAARELRFAGPAANGERYNAIMWYGTLALVGLSALAWVAYRYAKSSSVTKQGRPLGWDDLGPRYTGSWYENWEDDPRYISPDDMLERMRHEQDMRKYERRDEHRYEESEAKKHKSARHARRTKRKRQACGIPESVVAENPLVARYVKAVYGLGEGAAEFDASVCRSVGLVTAISGDGKYSSCQFTAVSSYQFLTVSHLFDSERKILQMVYPGGLNASTTNFVVQRAPEGYDVCLVSLAPGVPPLPVANMTHRWAESGAPNLVHRVKMADGFLCRETGAMVAKNFDIDGETHHIVDLGGQFSDCGSPYYALEPQGGYFFGIHNGIVNQALGSGVQANMATVTPVPGWLINQLLDAAPKRNALLPRLKQIKSDGVLQFAQLESGGRTTGGKTKFVEAPLPWPTDKKLARLTAGPWGDPWSLGLDKLRDTTDNHDHGQYQWMDARAREHLAQFNAEYQSALSLIGWPDVVGYGEVGSSRSASWPYATKGDFVEEGHMSKYGLELCRIAEATLLAGGLWCFFCSNSLKDEKVSAERAEIGKTRVFYVMDAVHFFLARRYLGDWALAYKKSKNLRHCLGIRPGEFGRIVEQIGGDDPQRVFASEDVSGMDHQERCALVHALVDSVCKTYGNEGACYNTFYGLLNPDNYVRAALFEAQFCAVQILPPGARNAAMGCNVLLGQHVNKSGAFNTTEVNDTAADAFNREICGDVIRTAKWIHYSDDTVIAMDASESAAWLQRVEDFRVRTGIRLTGADKNGVKLGPLEEADILSRRFTRVNGAWCGVLAAETADSIMSHYRRNAFVDNYPAQALSACVELAPHGPHVYEQFAQRLLRTGMVAPAHSEALLWFNTWGGSLEVEEANTPPGEALRRMRVELVRSGWDNTGRSSDARTGKNSVTKQSSNHNMDNAKTISEPTGAPISRADITTYVDETGSDFPVNSTARRGFEPGGLVEINKHTIDTVLSRPITVAETSWVSGTAAETRIQSITLLEDYFAAHANALTKLQGFGFLRADAHIKVLVNAPPTAYGMLAIVALPQIPIVPDASDLSLSWYTGFPHVFLDLGDPNHTAEIDVPYVNFRLWSDVDQLFIGGFDSDEAQAYFDHAVVAVVVVSPLDAETATVEVAVQCSLYNIELKEPIPPRDLPAPSARVNSRRRTLKVLRQADEGGAFMKTIRTTAGMAKDVAGVAHAVTGTIAGGLGASVSADYAPVLRIQNLGITDSIAHVAGQDTSVILSSTRESRVLAPQGLFGVDHDEMNISRFAQREAIFSRTTWNTGDQKGEIIGAFPVDPAHVYRLADPAAGFPYRHKTIPLSYAALMFAVYRGGITFSLRAVKNSFFSGRLSLCFFPFDRTERAGPLTDEEVRSVHNAIVDVSQHSKTDFTCPYVNNAPWAPVIPTVNTPGSGMFTNPRPLGYFYIVVQQPLTVSSAVGASYLEIIISKRGAPDIEFGSIRGQAIPCFAGQTAAALTRTVQVVAGPEPVDTSSTVRSKLQSKSKGKNKEKINARRVDVPAHVLARILTARKEDQGTEQGGDDDVPCSEWNDGWVPERSNKVVRQSGVYQAPSAVEIAPGQTAAPKYPMGPLCLSESITSWRDVAHRFTLVNSTLATNYGGAAALENGPATTLYYVRMAYAYMTGSLRAMSATFTGAAQVGFIPLCDPALVTEDINAPVSRTAFYANGGTAVQTFVKVPWCEQYPFLPTGQGTNGAPVNSGVPSPRFGSFYNGTGTTSALVAAGDDFHCGFPIGTPPVALVTTNEVTTDNFRYQVNPFA